MQRTRVVLAAVCLAILAACTNAAVVRLDSMKRPQQPTDSVTVYRYPNLPSSGLSAYSLVGRVTVNVGDAEGAWDLMIKRARKEAAKLGADVVVVSPDKLTYGTNGTLSATPDGPDAPQAIYGLAFARKS